MLNSLRVLQCADADAMANFCRQLERELASALSDIGSIRDAALEEAANFADECEVGAPHVNAAIKIAEGIRALKSAPSDPTPNRSATTDGGTKHG